MTNDQKGRRYISNQRYRSFALSSRAVVDDINTTTTIEAQTQVSFLFVPVSTTALDNNSQQQQQRTISFVPMYCDDKATAVKDDTAAVKDDTSAVLF